MSIAFRTVVCFSIILVISCVSIKNKVSVEPNDISTIHLTVDNNLTELSVNGVPVPLPANSNDWMQTKTLDLNLRINDVISISGTNQGTWTADNPGGVIATIIYRRSRTNRVYNTGEGWECNGRPALLQGANQVDTIWRRVRGSYMPEIQGAAQWIWSQTADEASVTCTFKITCAQNNAVEAD